MRCLRCCGCRRLLRLCVVRRFLDERTYPEEEEEEEDEDDVEEEDDEEVESAEEDR